MSATPIPRTLAIILYCAAGLDYSGLAAFSPSMGMDVLSGLMKPNWGFVYDGSGEDLVSLLLLTIGIAFLGTAIATVLAIPVMLLSASNLWRSHPWVARVGKFVCNVLRAFPELVYAIIFVRVVGPGPFAGVLAIGVHQIGMLGKLYTEEMEAMDEEPVEAVRAAGGNFWQAMFYARVPQLMPIYTSLSLNHTDFTFSGMDNPSVQMQVSGTSSTPTWSVSDTSVATISADGVVRPAGPGTATITCTVDGQTLTCIVRCNF